MENKRHWTADEDAKLVEYVTKCGPKNWKAVQTLTGLRRSGKSCRLRWKNQKQPGVRTDPFTPEEEYLIAKYHGEFGSSWSKIAKQAIPPLPSPSTLVFSKEFCDFVF